MGKNELGGSQIHAHLSGAVDEVASEEEAFLTIEEFLSYLPQNVWQMPPIIASSDPVDRRDENLLSVIPRNRREMYEIGDIISAIVDRESFFEISPAHGQSLTVGLARLMVMP